jgi:hypothetical protein
VNTVELLAGRVAINVQPHSGNHRGRPSARSLRRRCRPHGLGADPRRTSRSRISSSCSDESGDERAQVERLLVRLVDDGRHGRDEAPFGPACPASLSSPSSASYGTCAVMRGVERQSRLRA